METVNNVCVAFSVSKEYSITQDCLDLWQNEEATSDRHQWPSIRLRLWIPLDCWIRHFSSTTNSQYRWRKNIRIREKSVYTAKLSGFKVPTLDSGFKISGAMTKPGYFYFGFVFLCVNAGKRQNQSATKRFRIHHESRTISSSVNLVLKLLQFTVIVNNLYNLNNSLYLFCCIVHVQW